MKVIKYIFCILFSTVSSADSYVDLKIQKLQEQVNNPLKVNLDYIDKGSLLKLMWVGQPVYIYRRTEKDLKALKELDHKLLADPKNAKMGQSIEAANYSSLSRIHYQLYQAGLKNQVAPFNSIDMEYIVLVGMDPVSTCGLNFLRENEMVRFKDFCSSRTYDAEGRLLASNPTDLTTYPLSNLYRFPYYKTSKNKLMVGPKGGYKSLSKFISTHEKKYEGLKPTQQLIIALRYNDYLKVSKILNQVTDLNYSDVSGITPLRAAIIGSNTDIVELLLKKKAKVTKEASILAERLKRQDVLDLLEKN